MNIFNRKRKKLEQARNNALNDIYSYYEIDTEERSIFNKTKQQIEDTKVELGIKNEAKRLLNEWINAPILKFGSIEFKNCLQIMYPFMSAYHIHDEKTAKFLNKNIPDLVNKEYIRIKNNYYN